MFANWTQLASNQRWHCYCYDQNMHKTWLHTFALNLLFVGIIAKLRSAIANHVPVGYQDESGFHLGVKQTQDRWPAIW